MKKFLSIILSLVLVIGLCVSPAFALTIEEKTNSTGDHFTPLCVIDMAANTVDGTSMSGPSPAGTYTGVVASQGSNASYVEGEGETAVTYPLMQYNADVVTQAQLAETHPHLVNNAVGDKIFKWTQTVAGSMFRLRGMVPHGSIMKGDVVKLSVEICLTDIIPYVDPTGATVPVDNTAIDSYQMYFKQVRSTSQSNYSSTSDDQSASVNIPVNKWVTTSIYYTTANDDITSIRIDQGKSPNNVNANKKPFPGTILIGKISYEKVNPNNMPIDDPISYKDDFDTYFHAPNVYDITGADQTNKISDAKYPMLTPIATADNGVLNEAHLSYKDTANPNDTSKYSIGQTIYDATETYKYTYPTSGTAMGKYHLFGDATLGDTGVKDASFGLGYAGETYITSADDHLSAADRFANSTAKRSLITLPNALSGKSMLVATGLYTKNGSVRFNNIFSSHPVAKDVGKKFVVSFYVYPDSTMGAYKSTSENYADAEPIEVDKTTPVKLTASFNGPVGNIYKYNSSYEETKIATINAPWDTWTKVDLLCEITTEGIDNLSKESLENTLKNSIQISQYEAEGQIADTLYFDDLQLNQIEAGTQASYSVYEFDGSYDIAAKITSTTETGNSTVQLVVAEYDSTSGKLVAVYTSASKDFNFNTVPVAVSLSNIKPIKASNNMRAFLIDSYTGLCPYISPGDVKALAEVIG